MRMSPFSPPKVADPLDVSTLEEDIAIPIIVAPKVTSRLPLDETKPLVVGDLLSDKGITAWLTDKLYHNEVSEPWPWTIAVTYIVSRLQRMKKYETTRATLGSLVRRHIFFDNRDFRDRLHWFVCAMDYSMPGWAFRVWNWEPV